MATTKLSVSIAPHISSSEQTRTIMLDVLVALLPAMITGLYVFGLNALLLTLTCVAACVATEHFIQIKLMKRPTSVGDLSAVVAGVLLAFNLPASLPLWMAALGGVFCIAIAKMCYGGIGFNPFNPALIGRVFLMLSFPVAMTSWPAPLQGLWSVDGVTTATPLSVIKEGLKMGEPLSQLMAQLPTYADLFVGVRGGCIGETSVVALVLGGAYLLWRGVITWHIPVFVIVGAGALAAVLHVLDPGKFVVPTVHILTGGMMLGAIFMATDYTTSPMTFAGMIVFALAIGMLTVLIRIFGGYPEGMCFAILIMNAFVPMIDKAFKPYRFGEGR